MEIIQYFPIGNYMKQCQFIKMMSLNKKKKKKNLNIFKGTIYIEENKHKFERIPFVVGIFITAKKDNTVVLKLKKFIYFICHGKWVLCIPFLLVLI